MAENGASARQIQQAGRWKSAKVAECYIEHSDRNLTDIAAVISCKSASSALTVAAATSAPSEPSATSGPTFVFQNCSFGTAPWQDMGQPTLPPLQSLPPMDIEVDMELALLIV